VTEDIAVHDDPRLQPYARVGDAAWLEDQGLFVAEGRLVVERLVGARRDAIQSVLVTPAARAALGASLDQLDADVLVCTQDVMSRVTGFNFHRGCLALARRLAPASLDPWFEGDHVLLALDGVGNPDNVGGLFRTAAAFGAAGIVISPTTGDPLYRKAVRTSMGAVLSLPWMQDAQWPEALRALRAKGYRNAALTPHHDAIPIERFAASGHRRVVLLLGAEGPGLNAAALAAADDRVRIPMAGAVDSLNVTVAAGVALHALQRFEAVP
jgi:tRNA G18 (ribose-2'-O)-methylase SpoU